MHSNPVQLKKQKNTKQTYYIIIIIRFWTDRSLSLDYFTTCHPRRITRNFPRASPFSISSLSLSLFLLSIWKYFLFFFWFADRNVLFSPPILRFFLFFTFTNYLVYCAHIAVHLLLGSVCFSLHLFHLFSLFRLCFHYFNDFSPFPLL